MLVEAAHVFLPQTHEGNSIMVALAPPQRVVDALRQDGGEPPEDLHVTMAYLGKTKEYDPDHLQELPGKVAEWAQRHPRPAMSVEGSGTFLARNADGPHVLHALVNAPGLHRMQADLTDHLRSHGYRPREDYGYIPHVTLGYTKHDVRFLPKVPRMSWQASKVWTAIGGSRQGHPFRED